MPISDVIWVFWILARHALPELALAFLPVLWPGIALVTLYYLAERTGLLDEQ